MRLLFFLDNLRVRLFNKLCVRRIKLSDGSVLHLTNAYIDGERLILGKDIYIGPNATILCRFDEVKIEDHVVIGPGVTLVESNHITDDRNNYIKHSGIKGGGVKIEQDCWLGANVTVLAGVTIGRGSVIGACSCVTKSIPPYSIAVGVPAKVIKRRFDSKDIQSYETNIQLNISHGHCL